VWGQVSFRSRVVHGFRVGSAFVGGLVKRGANEVPQRVFAEEDPDPDGAPCAFLLDRTRDRAGGARPWAVMFRQADGGVASGEAFRVSGLLRGGHTRGRAR